MTGVINMKLETKRLIISELTMDMAKAVHLNSLDDLPEMTGLEEDGQMRLDELGAETLPVEE